VGLVVLGILAVNLGTVLAQELRELGLLDGNSEDWHLGDLDDAFVHLQLGLPHSLAGAEIAPLGHLLHEVCLFASLLESLHQLLATLDLGDVHLLLRLFVLLQLRFEGALFLLFLRDGVLVIALLTYCLLFLLG
jgi:hypothetical protein